jgi:hypothetical protein
MSERVDHHRQDVHASRSERNRKAHLFGSLPHRVRQNTVDSPKRREVGE